MLFKILGYVTSFGNIATIYMLVENGIIQKIGSSHWTVGIASVMFLSFISILFFYLNNKEEGINTLRMYGYGYTIMTVLFYGFLSIKNLYSGFEYERFTGYLTILIFLSLITILILNFSRRSKDNSFFSFLASGLSLLSLLITFGSIYKYIFIQQPIEFYNVFTELLMIGIGCIMFIGAYIFSNK